MINDANVQAVSDATQLTTIKQQGADNLALGKEQSDNVKDYVGDGQDVFGAIISGKLVNDEMLKGIHVKGAAKCFSEEGGKVSGVKLVKNLI